jgi:hypothetical protein
VVNLYTSRCRFDHVPQLPLQPVAICKCNVFLYAPALLVKDCASRVIHTYDQADMHLQPACPSSCTSLSLARARYLARAVQVARTVPGSTQVHLGHGYGCSHTARQRARAALAQRLENAISKCLSAAVAVSLLLGQPAAQAEVGKVEQCKPARAQHAATQRSTCMLQDVTITYPASPDPAIRAAQQTLVESWAYVSAYYVDHNFNGTDWKQLAQVGR